MMYIIFITIMAVSTPLLAFFAVYIAERRGLSSTWDEKIIPLAIMIPYAVTCMITGALMLKKLEMLNNALYNTGIGVFMIVWIIVVVILIPLKILGGKLGRKKKLFY